MVDKIYNEYMVSTNIEIGKIYYFFLVYNFTIVNIENIFHQKVMMLHDSASSRICYDD
jgi:hypothetical protein